MDKKIEKIFRKYILEVDDAIEAHGFKSASYIDYAEDSIAELEDTIKKQLNEHGPEITFSNLQNHLNTTAQNIVDYTKQTAYNKSNNNTYLYEKITDKASNLLSDLDFLNTRLINSFENKI